MHNRRSVRGKGQSRRFRAGETAGYVRGKLEGMTQVYYTKLHYSAEQIAQELGAPVAQIEQLIRQLQIGNTMGPRFSG